MDLPKLDIASLPTLDTVTAMFGSLSAGTTPGSDDSVVMLMVFLYELFPPEALI